MNNNLAFYLERIEPAWALYVSKLEKQGLPIPPDSGRVEDEQSYEQFRQSANKILAQIVKEERVARMRFKF